MMRIQSLHPVLLVLALAGGVFTVTACDEATPVSQNTPSHDAPAKTSVKGPPGNGGSSIYLARLTPLNGSGVRGRMLLTVRNGQFAVKVNALGLVPNKIHAQHIHAKLDDGGGVSTCPTSADDANGDGLIQVGEGLPKYGGIQVPLDGSLDEAEGLGDAATFPTPENRRGVITYRQTVAVEDLALNSGGGFSDLTLGNHAVVLHGAFVDGAYSLTLPVACGTIEPIRSFVPGQSFLPIPVR